MIYCDVTSRGSSRWRQINYSQRQKSDDISDWCSWTVSLTVYCPWRRQICNCHHCVSRVLLAASYKLAMLCFPSAKCPCWDFKKYVILTDLGSFYELWSHCRSKRLTSGFKNRVVRPRLSGEHSAVYWYTPLMPAVGQRVRKSFVLWVLVVYHI